MFIKHTPSIQIGLWYHNQNVDLVWFDKQNQAQCLHLDDIDLLDLPSALNRHSNYLRRSASYKYITSIMPHQIWQKTLILPHNLTPVECEQQCHFTLTNELPIPINEIWYDYAATPLKQGFRLEIFAIRQQIAKDYLHQFAPLQIDVLDNTAKAILRATEYVLGKPFPANAVLLYQDALGALAVQHKLQQTQTLFQTDKNLTALLAQYCQRYDEQPEQIFYYQMVRNDSVVPKHWRPVETHLPLIALGNALWQQEIHKEDDELFRSFS